ncbi:MAG: (d)CMP kinase [Myxococcota bacterium]
MTELVVAIDGPAGAGKSTIAKRIAEGSGLSLVDTGAIYRALALLSQREQIEPDDEATLAARAASLPIAFHLRAGINRVSLAGEDVSDEIRSPAISMLASAVSRHPAVREALLSLQRQLGTKGAVLEGRDIGTVVFPDAAVKVFLTASAEERARRRCAQLVEQGKPQPYEQVLREIVERDRVDSGRTVAPLRPAADAVVLDSTALSEDEVVTLIRARIDAAKAVREA